MRTTANNAGRVWILMLFFACSPSGCQVKRDPPASGTSAGREPVQVGVAPESDAAATVVPVDRRQAGKVAGVPLAPVRVTTFGSLTPAQKRLAYHLIRAAEIADRIFVGQLHRANLEIKALLETLALWRGELTPSFRGQLLAYLGRFWLHRGHHDLHTGVKLVPDFTLDQLRRAARMALAHGVDIGPTSPAGLERLLRRLGPHLYEPRIDPTLTAPEATPADRVLAGSAVDFYRGITTARARAFVHRYPRNSRLVQGRSGPAEEVWRAGGEGAPEGVFVNELHHVIKHLGRAREMARDEQARALGHLISYFRTGAAEQFQLYLRRRSGAHVDLLMGFFHTHRDPLGLKGTLQALVTVGCSRGAQGPKPSKGSIKQGPRAGDSRCELIYAAGDPGPGLAWKATVAAGVGAGWSNIRAGVGAGLGMVFPVYVATRDRAGKIVDVRLRPPGEWSAYNLARARAWRVRCSRSLMRASSSSGARGEGPSRAGAPPGKGRLLNPLRRPLDQLRALPAQGGRPQGR